MAEPKPDNELLAAYRAGDEDAASALFERYYMRLRGLIRQQMGWRIAEEDSSADVAQSALHSFFDEIRDQHIRLDPGKNLWPLLVTITLNKVRRRGKYWARQKRDPQRRVPLADGLDPLERGASPQDAAVLQDLIDRLLLPFSERRQHIIRLLLEGYSVSEIAARVSTTARTVYNTRQAAAAVLKNVLELE